jgi:hypothetical protein
MSAVCASVSDADNLLRQRNARALPHVDYDCNLCTARYAWCKETSPYGISQLRFVSDDPATKGQAPAPAP